MSSDRKYLLNVGSDVRGMRNWPLFLFLGGLVFFFYFLYVYQAQGAEYEIVRSELQSKVQKIQTLTVDFVSAKAENEQLSDFVKDLKKERDAISKDYETCLNSLRSCKVNAENLLSQNRMLETNSKDKDVNIKNLQQKIEELTKSNEALKKTVSDQEVVADQLNGTIKKLEDELNRLKSGATTKDNTYIGDRNGTILTRRNKIDQEQQKIADDKQTSQPGSQLITQSVLDGGRLKLEYSVRHAVTAKGVGKGERPLVKGGKYEGDEDIYRDLQSA